MTDLPAVCRVAVLASLLVLVAACSGDQSISQNARLDAAAGMEPGGSAAVLVGLRVLSEPTEHGLFDIFQREVHPVYDVQIRQITEEGRLGRFSRRVNICESTRAFLNGALSDCRPDQTQYKVLAVPPGRYIVESIAYQAGRTRIVTTFNQMQATGFFDNPASAGRAVREPGRSFVVSPGTVTYIGDLVFFFDPSSAAAKMSLGRNDAAAHAALLTYPNVHGTPVFRRATGNGQLNTVPGALMPIEGAL